MEAMTMESPKSEVPNPKPDDSKSQDRSLENFGLRISSFSGPWQTPGLAPYYVICLVSMSVIWLVLLRRALPTSATLFPILVGILGIAARWRLAPVLLLATLAVCLKFESTYDVHKAFHVSDLILCTATLAYIVAQFRLQGLLDHIIPIDPRRRQGSPRWQVGMLSIRYQPKVVREARSPTLVNREEIGMLILGSALWAGLAQVCWNLLPMDRGNPGFPQPVWRAIVVAWIIGAGLYVVFGFLDYWSQRVMTAEEAALFLQDILWKETRGEQRRLNRWHAWARLRRPRKNSE
jgi:hypothetical protein